MFSRSRKPAPEDAPSTETVVTRGKGRPTPSRREAEAARRRPLVPVDRKAAAQAQKEALRAQRRREYQAMLTGDEKHLPVRDRGRVRRFVRDHVDARWNLGEFFLPFSILMVFAILVTGSNIRAAAITIVVLYTVVLVTILDGVVLGRKLRKRLAERFDADEIPRGTVMYGVIRAFQIRRSRMPRPQVARGQYPR